MSSELFGVNVQGEALSKVQIPLFPDTLHITAATLIQSKDNNSNVIVFANDMSIACLSSSNRNVSLNLNLNGSSDAGENNSESPANQINFKTNDSKAIVALSGYITKLNNNKVNTNNKRKNNQVTPTNQDNNNNNNNNNNTQTQTETGDESNNNKKTKTENNNKKENKQNNVNNNNNNEVNKKSKNKAEEAEQKLVNMENKFINKINQNQNNQDNKDNKDNQNDANKQVQNEKPKENNKNKQNKNQATPVPSNDNPTTPTKNKPETPNKTNETPEAKKKKIVSLASGLKYEDIEIGTGPVATHGKNVSIRYKGMFESGRVFDTNMPRGKPLTFKLGAGDVVKGFDEGTNGMKVGGKRTIVVPPHLGYGKRGAPPDIPGNATLIFNLHLIGTK